MEEMEEEEVGAEVIGVEGVAATEEVEEMEAEEVGEMEEEEVGEMEEAAEEDEVEEKEG